MMLLTNMVRGTATDFPAGSLLQHWEHDEGTLKFWRASSNFVYWFERSGERYFLRFIHEDDNTCELIQAELDFIRYLIGSGYAAAAPVPSKNGRFIESIATEHGRYYGVVFEQAAGAHVPLERMTDAHFERWGQSLAALHELSESYRPGTALRRGWQDVLAFIASVLQRYPEDVALLRQLDRLREELDGLPSGTGHTGLIHFDFQTDNIFYSEAEERYCAIDFDDAMTHWFFLDIAAAVSDLKELPGEVAERGMGLFLQGYRSVKPLDEAYIERMPLFRKFADLYMLARLLRSVENLEPSGSPEWAIALKDKLLRACERIRELYLPAVTLAPVDHSNWYACSLLDVTEEQRSLFPYPNVYWLAESAYCGFTPLAVYSGDQPAGLAVYAVDPDDGSYWIMAFMIDRRYQGQGIGGAALRELIRHMKVAHGCDKIILGHRPDNERAARLYQAFGFEEIGRDDKETIRALTL